MSPEWLCLTVHWWSGWLGRRRLGRSRAWREGIVGRHAWPGRHILAFGRKRRIARRLSRQRLWFTRGGRVHGLTWLCPKKRCVELPFWAKPSQLSNASTWSSPDCASCFLPDQLPVLCMGWLQQCGAGLSAAACSVFPATNALVGG